MFINISKIVPWDPQTNELDFEKIDLWRISHANGNTKISSKETSAAKELVLVISKLWHKRSQRYKIWKFWLYLAIRTNEVAKEKEKEEKEKDEKNMTT